MTCSHQRKIKKIGDRIVVERDRSMFVGESEVETAGVLNLQCCKCVSWAKPVWAGSGNICLQFICLFFGLLRIVF